MNVGFASRRFNRFRAHESEPWDIDYIRNEKNIGYSPREPSVLGNKGNVIKIMRSGRPLSGDSAQNAVRRVPSWLTDRIYNPALCFKALQSNWAQGAKPNFTHNINFNDLYLRLSVRIGGFHGFSKHYIYEKDIYYCGCHSLCCRDVPHRQRDGFCVVARYRLPKLWYGDI